MSFCYCKLSLFVLNSLVSPTIISRLPIHRSSSFEKTVFETVIIYLSHLCLLKSLCLEH